MASLVCMGQNFVNGNPTILNCLPSVQFVTSSVLNQVILKTDAPKDTKMLQKISIGNFMIASFILSNNLLKANKIPQALLLLNLGIVAGKKLYELQSQKKEKAAA